MFRPRAADSAATTRSVTISCVSQRRSCLPSLVPGHRQRGGQRARAQSRLARIDFVDRYRNAVHDSDIGHMRMRHCTITFTAGE